MKQKKVKYTIHKKGRRTTLLRNILRERKITQTKLAEMAEMEIGQVSNLCTGLQSDCLLSTAKKICNVLEVKLDDIFGD